MPVKIDELYYELDARTQGFEDKLNHARTSIADFAQFVAEKPVLALGALAAAMVAVAFEATKMAAEVDASLRQVVAAAPEAAQHLGVLRQVIADISTESPRTQQELAEAAAEIAHTGAESIAEITSRLRIATTVADATGADLHTVIEGLSTITKAFSIDGQDAADALTRIFGATQGRVELEETFQVLRRGGSVLASLGVTAAQAGDAMAALLKGGIIPRQAGSVLNQIIDLTGKVATLKKGTDDQAVAAGIIESTMSRSNIAAKGFTVAIGELAGGLQRAHVDVDALGLKQSELNAIQRVAAQVANDHRTEEDKLADAEKRLAAAADTNRGSAEALSKLLKNEFNEALINLGNKILPTVIAGMKSLNELLKEMRGNTDAGAQMEAAFQALQTAGEKLAKVRQGGLAGFGVDAGTVPLDVLQRIGATLRPEQTAQLDTALAQSPGVGGNALTGVSDLLAGLKPLEVQYVRLAAAAKAAQVAFDDARKAAETPLDEGGDAPPPPKPTIAPLAQEVKDAIVALRRSINQAIAAETQTQIDDALIKVQQFHDAIDQLARKAGFRGADGRAQFLATQPALAAENARVQGLPSDIEAKERKKAIEDLETLKAKFGAPGSGVDAFAVEIAHAVEQMQKLNAEYVKLGQKPLFSPEDIARITAMNTSLATTTGAIKTAEALINAQRTSNRTDRLNEAIEIQNQVDILTSKRAAAKSDKERADIDAEIVRLNERLKALATEQDQTEQRITEEQRKQREAKLQEINTLQNDALQAVDGAVQVASEFGKMDAHTSAIVNGLKDGINAAAAFAKGDVVTGVIDTLEAAVSIGKGLFTHDKSPEQKAYERLLDQNTQALLQLNEHIGALGRVTATGADIQAFAQVLARTDITGETKYNAQQQTYSIQRQLEAMGYTIGDFRDYAKSLGVTLPDAIGAAAFKQVQEQAAKQSTQVAQYSDTFSGQMGSLQQAITLFDIKDPIKQFQEFAKSLEKIKGGSGALGDAVKTFDLTTADGIEKAKAALQQLFTQAQNGQLSVAQLGGLSGQDFVTALGDAKQYIDAISQSGTVPGTGGYNTDRSITEVTGSRMAALLTTGNVFAERTATAVESLYTVLAGQPLPTVQPPAFAPTATLATSALSALAATQGSLATAPVPVDVHLTLDDALASVLAEQQGALQQVATDTLRAALADPRTIASIQQGLLVRLNQQKLAQGQVS